MVRVLAHFLPSATVLKMVEPEADWLDIRWCHEDDDDTLHRELPEAEVVWHVLRPLSGDDLRRGERLPAGRRVRIFSSARTPETALANLRNFLQ